MTAFVIRVKVILCGQSELGALGELHLTAIGAPYSKPNDRFQYDPTKANRIYFLKIDSDQHQLTNMMCCCQNDDEKLRYYVVLGFGVLEFSFRVPFGKLPSAITMIINNKEQ